MKERLKEININEIPKITEKQFKQLEREYKELINRLCEHEKKCAGDSRR